MISNEFLLDWWRDPAIFPSQAQNLNLNTERGIPVQDIEVNGRRNL